MDAIEAAFLHALGCEVRTRAAENRAANAVADQRIAEADARISEQRMQLAQNLERETERERTTALERYHTLTRAGKRRRPRGLGAGAGSPVGG